MGRRSIRVLAYHGTPASAALSFGRQLDWLARRFEPAGLGDLAALLAGAPRARRGILFSFDDGLRSNYEVAAPLLEARGFRGLFFLTAELPGLPAAEQEAYCDAHAIIRKGEGGRVAMDWEEARELLERGHAIGCHTASHRRFRGPVDEALVGREIAGAKAAIEARLGREVESFAWVGGEVDTYSPAAAAALPAAGFRFAFTTMSRAVTPRSKPFELHRTMIDADLAFGLFKLKIAGASDLAKARRRAAATRALRGESL